MPSNASVAVPLNEMVPPALYVALTAGDVIDAVGGVFPTTTWIDAEAVWVPLLTVSVALYVPFVV